MRSYSFDLTELKWKRSSLVEVEMEDVPLTMQQIQMAEEITVVNGNRELVIKSRTGETGTIRDRA